jgi:cell wall-associated NlpC family hydrolase
MAQLDEQIPGVRTEMLSPEFWITKLDNQLCSPGWTREDCNATIRSHSPALANLQQILRNQTEYKLLPDFFPHPRELYDHFGKRLDEETWAALIENAQCRLNTKVVPAFVTRQTDLRSYPTHMRVFREETNQVYDRFQETTLHTFEPVLCVSTSRDQEWRYVISATYSGWVLDRDLANATTSDFEHFLAPEDVCVVTRPGIRTESTLLDAQDSGQSIEFAACLPLSRTQTLSPSDLSVILPTRGSDGQFIPQNTVIPAGDEAQRGYLPFNRQSVIRMAFQLLGERYGWGGSFGLHDCSSFVMDVYRLLGVQLPRNAGDQEVCLPDRIKIPADMSSNDRCKLLNTLSAGDLLFMPGHVMLYLGCEGNRQYVIHDFAGYAAELEGQKVNIDVHSVMVSHLDLELSNGKAYLQSLTSAVDVFHSRTFEGEAC